MLFWDNPRIKCQVSQNQLTSLKNQMLSLVFYVKMKITSIEDKIHNPG